MGLFANTLTAAVSRGSARPTEIGTGRGIVNRLFERLRRTQAEPRLTLVERISLAPRQFLALVEADGELLLVGTSQDGSPRFCRLHSRRSIRRSDAIPLKGTVA